MNIIQAIEDRKLFKPFLTGASDSLDSWKSWKTALKVLYGLPTTKLEKGLIRLATGRRRKQLPDSGFQTGLFLCGRRSGKSRIASLVGAFEACLAERETKLAPGETGVVAIVSPTKNQSKVVRDYLEGIFETPLLKNEVVRTVRDGFDLRNRISIRVLPGDWRSVRSFTLCAVIADEICFHGLSVENKVRSDTELIRALRPGLATTGGKLLAISSPHARKGWAYQQYKKCFGNDNASTLVWNAASRVMNSTLSQKVVDAALAEDPASAKAEYLAEFRSDVCDFVSREVVESRVIPGRKELLPIKHNSYNAFVDLSGGRKDDATLAIAHKVKRKVILDYVRRWRAPFNPMQVIGEISEELKRYRLRRASGDNYSAEFVSSGFKTYGIHYTKSSRSKSDLYLELLPQLCSDEVELLDDEALIEQLAGLERRTRSGGRDLIDHATGAKDDLANAVAGAVCHAALNKHTQIGVF